MTRRWLGDRLLAATALLVLLTALAMLGLLLWQVTSHGMGRLSLDFLTGVPSRHPERAGLLPALAGSALLVVLATLMALPLGLGAAIYLEEYGRRSRLARLVEINIANLAGVPSVIYGLLGLGLFVQALALGQSVVAGASTLALLVLPIVILSTREALRAVPRSVREASFALGATRWQTIRHQVLPLAWPGILTGVILTTSRAVGETAPLIVIGGLAYVAFVPDGLMSPFTALPLQIFDWVSRPQPAFRQNAAAAILVLLALLLSLNAGAIWLRDRLRARRWS